MCGMHEVAIEAYLAARQPRKALAIINQQASASIGAAQEQAAFGAGERQHCMYYTCMLIMCTTMWGPPQRAKVRLTQLVGRSGPSHLAPVFMESATVSKPTNYACVSWSHGLVWRCHDRLVTSSTASLSRRLLCDDHDSCVLISLKAGMLLII